MKAKRSPDRARVIAAVSAFLDALGHDLEDELAGTPERVANAWIDELLSGEAAEPAARLEQGAIDLGAGDHGLVVLRDVAVSTVCPHHLLPSHGMATLGYLPTTRAAGLGALAEVASLCSRRLTLQEELGQEIADAILLGLKARGAFCKLDLVHTCFVARGERQATSVLSTLSLVGTFKDQDRALALAAVSSAPRSGS